MSVCPNKNLPEWKTLVEAVGEFEAFKDFVETKGQIRTAEEVQQKIDFRNYVARPLGRDVSNQTLEELVEQDNPVKYIEPNVQDNMAALEFADKLSLTLGIDYEMVTPEQALEITTNAKNPWSGESAFFMGGKVYFIAGHLSTAKALHEFSHPLVRAIGNENKTLFNKLHDQVLSSSEGQEITMTVQELYPELENNSDLFKEEVIVRALEKAGLDQLDEFKQETGFKKAINNILYAIKQFLRKSFGKKSAVSKLSPNTSLKELSEMLVKGGNLKLDSQSVSDKDLIAYERERTQYIEDLNNIKSAEMQALVNRVYDISSKHIDTLMSRKEYDELALILTDEFRRGDLQEMKSRVQEYQNMVSNIAESVKEDMEYERKRSTAFIDSMFRLEKVMDKILVHMEDIISDTEGDSKENLHKAYYYRYLVDYWGSFIEEAKKPLTDRKSGVPKDSPVIKLIANIERSINAIKDVSDELYADGARDALYEELSPMGENIKNRYQERLERMREKGASQQAIDKVYKQYHGLTEAQHQKMKALQGAKTRLNYQQSQELERLQNLAANGIAITPEKIERLLRGELGDSNFFSSYLEGYLYNTDPVVGGLALYVKNQLNEVMVGAQAKYNEFAMDMKPLLEKAGYNPNKIGEFGQKVGFKDKISVRDPETGELTEKEVWTLHNPFKNYRFDFDKHNASVDNAQKEHALSGTDEDHKKLVDAITDRQEFLRKYFHQQYVPEYYERQSLFEKDEIGKEALVLRKNLFERMRAITETATTEMDKMGVSDKLDALWQEYRQLHSVYDLNGALKNDKERAIAQRLQDYREASYEFYEWKERKGVFENAYFQYRQELTDNDIPEDSDEFKALLQEWIQRNTRTVVKDEYYERRSEVIGRISEILQKLPDADRKDLDQSEVWSKILALTSAFRDSDGQPDATQLSKGAIKEIKTLQKELELMRGNYAQRNGLTKFENAEMSQLYEQKTAGTIIPKGLKRMRELYNKKKTEGLSKWDTAELDGLYEELSEMSKKESTDYYVDIMNNWLSKLNTNQLYLATGSREITKQNANVILDNTLLEDLLEQNSEFAQWFNDNHIQKDTFNKETRTEEIKWERLYAWNVVRPTNEEHMETYEIKDISGSVVEKVAGLPSTNYYARVVKSQYKNERIVGETVDNKGNWLPKTLEQGAADDRYINQDYYKMQREDPNLFNALEKLKEHHLKNQEGLGRRSKLYLDFPRFRKSNLEVVQTSGVKNMGKEKMNALTIWAQRVKEFFTGAKDDAEDGFNDKDEFNLVRADMFDNEVTSIPIHGLYDIDLQDVSTDITHSMMKYMMSAERQKQLIKISPMARAVQSVVNNPANTAKEMDQVNKFNFMHRGVKTYLNKKGRYVRASAVNNFIEREFEGQRMTGATKDVKWLNNAQSLMFKRASFGFFALNIPSALKNSMGAKFQGLIEASAGKHMSHVSFQKGNAWAYKTMGELSFANQLYKKGPKSLNQQIVEIFDPSQDRFEDKFGEGLSRTIVKDMASMSWLYNFRRWVELQATIQTFAGMMYHEKIERTIDGQTTEIPYMDAWEVVDGKIQLKSGIDPKWGITYDKDGKQVVGKSFKAKRNQVHQVMNNLQGAYAKFDQPEAQRYLGFRFLSYLRRYFTTMTLNRFGFTGNVWDPQPRMNPGMGDIQTGFYITFLNTVKETITRTGKNLQYMSREEKEAALRMVTEVGMLVGAAALMSLAFGWDPDDEDKFIKLRAHSGALPFLGTVDDPDRQFNLPGYLENHALLLLMNIRAENEQFIPLPGFGMDDMTAMLDLKSIAFGPTINTYTQMFDDIINIASGNDRAYYSKTVGPYSWQQEGGSKFWAHFTRTFGLTGSSLDPAKAIKGFQSVQARAR